MLLFIYLLAFLLFYKSQNVNKKPVYKFILGLYIVSVICAILCWYCFPEYSRRYPLSFLAIVYHIFVIGIMLFPLGKYDIKIQVEKIAISYSALKPFLWFLIALSIISIISSFYTYSIIIKSGVSIVDGRNASIAGDSFMLMTKPPGSILSHISAIASELCYITLFFAFYIKCFYPKKKWVFRLLLISSTVALFWQLEWFGRENIVRFIFDFVIIFLMFQKFMSKQTLKVIKKYIIIGGGIVAAVFIAITLSRFDSDVFEAGPIYGVLSYAGQGFIYFSNYFDTFGLAPSGDGWQKMFTFFFPNYEHSIFNTGAQSNVDAAFNMFKTYVGTFIGPFGIYKALIPLGIMTIFCLIVGTMSSSSPFFYIYILWIYRFFSMGIFYWIDKWNNGDRILCILLILFLNILYNLLRNNNRYYHVKN